MNTIYRLTKKNTRLAIGLMSGTCTDGIDAALVEIEGYSTKTKVKLLKFITIPYELPLRKRLLEIALGTSYGSEEICKMNFLLGHLSSTACIEVCKKANIAISEIDFIGSHGHTIYHQPNVTPYFNHEITSTLQIGEAAVISESMNCPVVSDFRVRDMAAGGGGAPLVPYTEYLLYSQTGKNIALQNIGGIGNITFLPANHNTDQIIAFDTGPGNMIIDALVSIYSNGKDQYDSNGDIAKSATVHKELLNWLMQDKYIHLKAPKTTGREYYGAKFVKELLQKADYYNLTLPETIATATMFTAKSIEIGITLNLPLIPDELIIGGGGSLNKTLMSNIKSSLPHCNVITNEDLGFDSNAKEAIAFAVLANETLHGCDNTIPTATGARHSVVMGKITL
jgi:anhydro-N-acetylmuramic acid kinase